MLKRFFGNESSRGDYSLIKTVTNHIERHIGPIAWVMDEKVSNYVHVDVHVVNPSPERNFITLVTSGMSEVPMKPPHGVANSRHAELVLCLPPDWPLSMEAFEDERNYWPVRLLKNLARDPHANKSWLWAGHSLVLSDPPKPFAANTEFEGAMLGPAATLPEEAQTIRWGFRRKIHLLGVYPVHSSELEFKLTNGMHQCTELFISAGITELLDPTRPSLVVPI